LLARNRVADLDQHARDVALHDVFSQLGDFEFLHVWILAGSGLKAQGSRYLNP
jgi:hypothetical protein